MNRSLNVILSLLLFAVVARGQDSSAVVDSLSGIIISPKDTLNTAVQDTSKNKSYNVDTVIVSTATDSIIFHVSDKKMDLFGNSELKYGDTDLKSGKIFVDFNTHNVDAFGVKNDSAEGAVKNTPVLSQAGEVYKGSSMTYNYKTQGGIISQASTKTEGSYYTGEKIKKVDKEIYFIKDGRFTTCDAKPPHYYFYSPEMKLINKKEIISKWIWLYFGGVPFPIPLPFAIFPLESGRRSGIIVPAFGSDPTYGYYFSRFGYFWAINDYMDLSLTADYYTRGSYNLKSRFRYVKRYNYSGSFEGGYSYFKTGEPGDPGRTEKTDWRLMWRHNQRITPTMQFNANLEFISGNYLQRNVQNLNELLRNDIVSNATLTKTWDESGNSMTLSYSRQQSLQSGDIHELLPSVTFSMPQKYPFKREGIFNDQKWYELIGINYNGQFQNRRNKVSGNLSSRGGFQHRILINASPKFGHISLTPSINYTEDWYNKRVKENYAGQTASGQDSIVTEDVKALGFVRTFGLSLTGTTRFYGIFQPNALGIAAIRHTVIPSVQYNYSPDFSQPGWGYYGTYVNSKGETVKYDKYQREIFGGATSGEQQSISFSLSNIFEMKTTVDPTDTTSQQKKIQLLNFGASMSYNFAADSLRFSNLNLNYRTQVANLLNLSGSSSFSLYDNAPGGQLINKFLINEGKGLLRLTNFSLSMSTSLSGEKLKSSESDQNQAVDRNPLEAANPENVYKGIYDNSQPDFSIPWDLSLSYNYNLSKPSPSYTSISSNLSGSLNFNLTPKWKLSFTGSYDLKRSEFAAPQIRISRDLHAWIMNFTWNPVGIYSGYYLEIRVKAPQLQDLKVTKRDQFYNGK